MVYLLYVYFERQFFVLFYFLLWGKVGGVEICRNLRLVLMELFVSLVSISVWSMHCLIVKEKHLCGLSDLSVHSLWVARPISACGQTCSIFALCGCQTCQCLWSDLCLHALLFSQCVTFVRQVVGCCVQLCDNQVNKVSICICQK